MTFADYGGYIVLIALLGAAWIHIGGGSRED